MLYSYAYDAFGNLLNTVTQASAFVNDILYASERYDSVTDTYYLRARNYAPDLGRFTCEDDYLGDGRNLYTYVSNNPLRFTDPSGYCKESGWNKFVQLVRKIGKSVNDFSVDVSGRIEKSSHELIDIVDQYVFEPVDSVRKVVGSEDFENGVAWGFLNAATWGGTSLAARVLSDVTGENKYPTYENKDYFERGEDFGLGLYVLFTSFVQMATSPADVAVGNSSAYEVVGQTTYTVDGVTYPADIMAPIGGGPQFLVITSGKMKGTLVPESGMAGSGKVVLQDPLEGTFEGNKGSSIDDLLKGLKETTNGKGVARNFESSGGYEQTLKDFDSLNPSNVKEIQTKYGPGKVGELSDGTKIVARQGSTTGGPTLEITVSNSKVFKIRY